jgi:hypothetical protein
MVVVGAENVRLFMTMVKSILAHRSCILLCCMCYNILLEGNYLRLIIIVVLFIIITNRRRYLACRYTVLDYTTRYIVLVHVYFACCLIGIRHHTTLHFNGKVDLVHVRCLNGVLYYTTLHFNGKVDLVHVRCLNGVLYYTILHYTSMVK